MPQNILKNLRSEDKKIVVMFLSPHVTLLVRPIDQNVTQATKFNYHKKCVFDDADILPKY